MVELGCASSLSVHPRWLEESYGMWSASFDILTVSICILFSCKVQYMVLGKMVCFLHSHWEASSHH